MDAYGHKIRCTYETGGYVRRPNLFLTGTLRGFFSTWGGFGDGIYPRLSPTGMGYEVMALVALVVGGVIVAGLPRDAQNAGLK